VSKPVLPIALTLTLALLATVPAIAETLNDPMRPPGKAVLALTAGGKQAVAARYRLDSVIIAANRRQAIVNGKRLTVGEHIGRATLIDVQATQVTLRVAGKSYVVPLLPLSIKMPSEAKRQ
jgi:MSHA biogenesis protein MshK